MANQVILKKSSVAARVPVAGDLTYGELAINYADGVLYYKKPDNTIGSISGTAGATTGVLTIGTGLTGTSFNGSSAVTIAIDSTVATLLGTQSLSNKTLVAPVLGTPVSGNFSTGTFTWPTFNQNTTGSAGSLVATLTGSNVLDVISATIASDDYFRIRIGGTSTDNGFAEIATADGGNEPIYVRQYSPSFSSIARTLTLLDGSGNTTIPGTLTIGGASATINNSTVLHAGNYNTYAPSLTGTGASGNWNINAATATSVSSIVATLTGSNKLEIIRANIADNDFFRILVGGTAGDAGFVEFATADSANEPIYFRQYNGTFTTLTRTLTLLDESGNTLIPGTLTINGNLALHAGNYTSYVASATGTGASGTWGISITGNAATATSAAQISKSVSGSTSADLISATMASDDAFRIRVGGTATDAGFVEIATADGGDEPIYFRQYTGNFTSIQRTLILLDASGNTTLPGTLTISGNKVISLAGNFTTSGAFNTTLTATATTSVTLPTTGTLATLAGTETLTNKTLTSPVIATIVNTGTLTLPTSTDTLVGRATTDTLTNKTLTSPVIGTIVNTGTLTLPTSTDTLIGRATTDTLTNKTLTSPTLTAPVLGTPVSGTMTNVTGLPLTTGVTGILPQANGGTGTATPSIVAGTNVTVTGTWPNQTINSTASGGGSISVSDEGTLLTSAATSINFVGASVTATNTSGAVTVTVSGSGGSGGGTTTIAGLTNYSYTATAAQTTFSATYQAPYVDVFINGVRMSPSDYTATSGTEIVLAVAANAGDTVDLVTYTIGGFDATAALALTNTTQSTSTTTGALKVTGGVGIIGNVNIAGTDAGGSPPTVEYLVVGGGGGGGYSDGASGAGGAGGFRTATGFAVTTGAAITVTVGAGGASRSTSGTGNSGNVSVFGTITAAGGGGGAGGTGASQAGAAGGSGGGGAYAGGLGGAGNTPATTPSQGNNGGTGSAQSGAHGTGGGGGAGGVGGTGTTTVGGAGGIGAVSTIITTTQATAYLVGQVSSGSVYFAGGGGGGNQTNAYAVAPGGTGGGGSGNGNGAVGTDGTANTGGGAGGAPQFAAPSSRAGGSGVVIIRYPDSYAAASSTTGSPIILVENGYRTYIWKASGSVTFTATNVPTPSTSSTTGALTVGGGLGVAGNINSGGTVAATQFTGNGSQLTGVATLGKSIAMTMVFGF